MLGETLSVTRGRRPLLVRVVFVAWPGSSPIRWVRHLSHKFEGQRSHYNCGVALIGVLGAVCNIVITRMRCNLFCVTAGGAHNWPARTRGKH